MRWMGRYRFDTSYAEPVANALRGSVGEVASEVEVVPCPYPEAARPESPFWGRVVAGAALMWESM